MAKQVALLRALVLLLERLSLAVSAVVLKHALKIFDLSFLPW